MPRYKVQLASVWNPFVHPTSASRTRNAQHGSGANYRSDGGGDPRSCRGGRNIDTGVQRGADECQRRLPAAVPDSRPLLAYCVGSWV